MHGATLNQPIITFYSYGDRFVKFNVSQEQKTLSQPSDAVSILMRPKEVPSIRICTIYTERAYYYSNKTLPMCPLWREGVFHPK